MTLAHPSHSRAPHQAPGTAPEIPCAGSALGGPRGGRLGHAHSQLPCPLFHPAPEPSLTSGAGMVRLNTTEGWGPTLNPRGQSLGPFERTVPAFFDMGLACKAPGAASGTC